MQGAEGGLEVGGRHAKMRHRHCMQRESKDKKKRKEK